MLVPSPSQSSGPGSPRAVSVVSRLYSSPFERWADPNATVVPSALIASVVSPAAEWWTVWSSPTWPSSPMTATRTASRSSDAVMNATRPPYRLNARSSDAYGARWGLRSMGSPPPDGTATQWPISLPPASRSQTTHRPSGVSRPTIRPPGSNVSCVSPPVAVFQRYSWGAPLAFDVTRPTSGASIAIVLSRIAEARNRSAQRGPVADGGSGVVSDTGRASISMLPA